MNNKTGALRWRVACVKLGWAWSLLGSNATEEPVQAVAAEEADEGDEGDAVEDGAKRAFSQDVFHDAIEHQILLSKCHFRSKRAS